ncbi:MAG: MotA/TolQ/ExbB proton channel family protein [Thermoanaerobaculia bacterium]
MSPTWSQLILTAPVQPSNTLTDAFTKSGPMAKLVLATLVGFSLASWAITFWKLLALRRAEKQSAQFLQAFARSSRFSEVNATAAQLKASPLVGLFQAGYAEIDTQIKSAEPVAGSERRYRIRSLAGVERSLQRALLTEVANLSRGNPFLATTAAATPFIGLFGTVWGIMSSFATIGATSSTSLDAIAPGIAEALINTAAGLAAAIPALIAYNHFSQRLRSLRARMQDFVYDFLNLTERNFT